MNSLVHSRSFFYRWILILFIGGMFADASNISDIFVGQTLEINHDDVIASVASQTVVSTTAASQSLKKLRVHTLVKQTILCDEDSPSIESSTHTSLIDALQYNKAPFVQTSSPVIFEELYLRNCTLLI